MITEQKQLLLKDLCARLPYKPQVVYNGVTETLSTLHIFDMTHLKEECVDIKPYLRPMTSMTEDEVVEYFRLQTYNEYADITGFKIDKATLCLKAYVDNVYKEYCWGDISNIKTFDWLNEHHFDFRGLIYEELALNAPTGMYEF